MSSIKKRAVCQLCKARVRGITLNQLKNKNKVSTGVKRAGSEYGVPKLQGGANSKSVPEPTVRTTHYQPQDQQRQGSDMQPRLKKGAFPYTLIQILAGVQSGPQVFTALELRIMQWNGKAEENSQHRNSRRLSGIKSRIGRLQISVMRHHSARSGDVDQCRPGGTIARQDTPNQTHKK